MIILKPAQQRLSCWLAILAMLVLTLLPTISRAMSTQVDAGNWAELCSASGPGSASQAHGDDDQGAPDHELAGHLDHCAACRITIDAIDLAPGPVAALVLPVTGAEPPELVLQAPRTHHVWRRAQTRAPPELS
ncbi:MAG: hypothetical protein RL375_2179 [Pseudomonadota bacterium]